jgi:hypothetical protein
VSEIAPAPPPAQRRPTVVTAAGYLLFGVALLAVLIALIPLPYASDVSAAAKRAYANLPNGDATATAVSATVYVSALIYVLAAAGLVVLGLFDLRGSNGARIATWVVAGIGVLCCGSGVLIGRLASGIGQSSNTAEMQAAQKQVQAAYPSWYTGVQTTLTVLALLALILVIILLALPAASAYFRRGKVQAPDPGLPPLAYPQVGGEPPVPPVPPVPPAPPTQRDQ